MEYQRIINLLDNTPNQPSKFRTKNWAELNDESRGIYNANSKIRFETNKNIIIKNCAPFTNCISEINNTLIDNAKDIDIMIMQNCLKN